MTLWREVWSKINSSDVSTVRENNRTIIKSDTFKALPISKQKSINDSIENFMLNEAKKHDPDLVSATDMKKSVEERLRPAIFNTVRSSKPITQRVLDTFAGMGMGRSVMGPASSWGIGQGGVANLATNAGMPGADPSMAHVITPNVWFNPYEANAIYSQGGIPTTIIKKKSQSILLNGVRIRNPKFTPEQIDKIKDNLLRLEFPQHIAMGTNWSLVYGGGLIFPMFKKDSPLSMSMTIPQLIKYGVVGKGCIDRFVTLDRWSTIHIPQWNPTAADFLEPERYFIPFLGCDVHGSRCARIVTAPQAGYIGNIITMGWGNSDMCGWYEAALNYMTVMSSIPTMINQMSLLARTINVDGVLATEGELILDEIAKQDTVRVRESSNVNDPINLDVIGDLKAIERDFAEVPSLVRLIRQDLGARATIPEELLFSAERGAFSSGDSTKSAEEKQWESIKYIHRDVARQLKYLTYLVVIDTLGPTAEVMKALPYTTIEFDSPQLTDAAERGEFFKNITTGFFNEVSGLMPADLALEVAAAVGDSDLPVNAEVIEELKARQKKLDDQALEKHNLQMDLLRAQVKQVEEQTKMEKERVAMGVPSSGGSTGGKAAPAVPKEHEKGGHNYEQRLERRKHDKVASEGKQNIVRLNR